MFQLKSDPLHNSANTGLVKNDDVNVSKMEELALRKEIEEKKRREGKLTEPKLTPKQKELLDGQLEKEKLVRQKVAKLKADVDQVK